MNPNLKVYVSVEVSIGKDGGMRPLSIEWENGRVYLIDRVTDVRMGTAMRSGGTGDRYTIWIDGHKSYLYFERSEKLFGPNIGRWFVERKAA